MRGDWVMWSLCRLVRFLLRKTLDSRLVMVVWVMLRTWVSEVIRLGIAVWRPPAQSTVILLALQRHLQW